MSSTAAIVFQKCSARLHASQATPANATGRGRRRKKKEEIRKKKEERRKKKEERKRRRRRRRSITPFGQTPGVQRYWHCSWFGYQLRCVCRLSGCAGHSCPPHPHPTYYYKSQTGCSVPPMKRWYRLRTAWVPPGRNVGFGVPPRTAWGPPGCFDQ